MREFNKNAWGYFPMPVLKSNKLNAEEKLLYITIWNSIGESRYCNLTNNELSNMLGITQQTLSARLAKMREKGYINYWYNPHLHKRWIYPNLPRNFTSSLPTEEDMKESTRLARESMQRAIILGTLDYNILVNRLLESDYFERVEREKCERQFLLTLEQIQFIADFVKKTGKEVDCQLAGISIDLKLLLKNILESDFLLANKNLNLKWCIEHAKDIIEGRYKTGAHLDNSQNKSFKGRDYESGQLNGLFQDINDLDI